MINLACGSAVGMFALVHSSGWPTGQAPPALPGVLVTAPRGRNENMQLSRFGEAVSGD
jgi:hypothetical protein